MKHFREADIAEVATALGDAAREFSWKTVLMSGARGFLGRYFSEIFGYLNDHVLEKPCTFVGLDNLLTSGDAGASFQERPDIHFIRHNIIQPLKRPFRVDFSEDDGDKVLQSCQSLSKLLTVRNTRTVW